MGEVWKAEDTQLRRTVALKFLSSETVGDEEIKARLIREAQASASLDHPNICQVFGIHEEQGQTFIAMAYIEGPSLADKIKERPLPLDESLDIAIQIAEGLQEAHEQGVVHRDIKPSNVMLDRRGRVKIMDFGLAAVADRTRLTKSGTTLGTPAYMSPEQAQGQAVDRRTDIWSLGVVLYELLTGKHPFPGEYEQAVVYSIINEKAEPVTAQRRGIPPKVDDLLDKALAKNSGERYQRAEDMLIDLKALLRGLSAETSRVRVGTTFEDAGPRAESLVPRRTLRIQRALLAAAIIALLIPTFFHLLERPPERLLRRFSLMPPFPVGSIGFFAHVSISPNGRHIAFVESRADGRLWVQDLDKDQPRPIEGSEGAFAPFWSPKSDFIGFAAKGELNTVSAQGGSAKRVCTMPSRICDGASWSPDGETIVFTSGTPGVLFEVPARGGTPALLIAMEDLEESLGEPVRYIARPHFLPSEAGPRTVAFTVSTTVRPNLLMVRDFQTGRQELLGQGDYPFYSQSGHLLYQPAVSTAELWALPFSLNTLQAEGDPFLVVGNGHGPTIAHDGTLVYSTVAGSGPQRLVWVDRQGRTTAEIAQTPAGVSYPSLSPDGLFVAVPQGRDQNIGLTGQDVWTYDTTRGVGSPLTTTAKDEGHAIWSPDGKEIAFTSSESGYSDIVLRRLDRDEEQSGNVLDKSPHFKSVQDWSSDGNKLVYQKADLKTGFDLYYLQRSEDGSDWEQHLFLQTPFNEIGAKFSPDGEYVAYVSDESGQDEVYVRSFPEGSFSVRVSANGGAQVRWSSDGTELFYLEGETLVATSVLFDPTFQVGSTTTLFVHQWMTRGIRVWNATYDVSADSQRFVVVQDIENKDVWSPSIHIVENWYEEFRERD